MEGLARLWIVCAAGVAAPALEREVRPLARLFAARRPAALYASRAHGASAALRTLATALELEPRAELDAGAGVLADLARIAGRHDGEELLCWMPAERMVQAVAGVFMEASEEAGPHLELRPFQLAALDWPSGRNPEALPALCGLDLDWLPPWRPGPARRFPGGPGVAASGRA